MSPLPFRDKTREDGKDYSLMPSDHLTSSKTRKQSKIKHQPQTCRTAHAVLAELFISIHVNVCQNHLYKGSVVRFSPPTLFFMHLRPVQLLAVLHPRFSGGFLFTGPIWQEFFLYIVHFRKADKGKDILLSCCSVLLLDKCITLHPPQSAPKYLIWNERKEKKKEDNSKKKSTIHFHTITAEWSQVVLQSLSSFRHRFLSPVRCQTEAEAAVRAQVLELCSPAAGGFCRAKWLVCRGRNECSSFLYMHG